MLFLLVVFHAAGTWFLRDEPEQRAAKPLLTNREKARGLERVAEIGDIEPIFNGVREEPVHERMVNEPAERFCGEE